MGKSSDAREIILEELRSGRYRKNDILPPVRQLAARCGTSVFSISKVLNQLAAEGILATRRGAPTRVLKTMLPEEPLKLRLSDVSELSVRKLKQLLFKKVFAASFQQRYPECTVCWEPVPGTGVRDSVDSLIRRKISFNSFHFTLLDFLINEKCIAPLPPRLVELHGTLPERFQNLGRRDNKLYALPFSASVTHFSMDKKLLNKAGWDPGSPFLKRSEFFELLRDMSRIAGKPALKISHGSALAMILLSFYHQDHPGKQVVWNSPEMSLILKQFLKAFFDDRSIAFFDPADLILPAEELYDPEAQAFLDSRLRRMYATARPKDFSVVPFPDSDSGRRFIPMNGLAWGINARQSLSQIRASGNYIAEYEEHLCRWSNDPGYDLFTVQNIYRNFHSGSCGMPFGVLPEHEAFYRELYSSGELEDNEADWEKLVVAEYVERLLQLPKRNNPEIWQLAFAQLN